MRSAADLAKEVRLLYEQSEAEEAEYDHCEDLLERAEQMGQAARRLKSALPDISLDFFTSGWGNPTPPAGAGWGGGDPGGRFVASEAFKSIADPRRRAERFSTEPVEVGPPGLEYKGTLTEATGGAGALIPVP